MLKERLQHWLTTSGTSRAELANKLHVSVRTVESWLGHSNPRPIPRNKRDIIEDIIRPTNDPGCIAVQVSFSEEEWAELTKGMPDSIDKEEAVKKIVMGVIKATRLPEE